MKNVKIKIRKRTFDWSNCSRAIAFYRRSLNLSQRNLAKLLGVTQVAIYYWERGIKEPQISNFVELAKILGVTETELLHPSDEVKEKIKMMDLNTP